MGSFPPGPSTGAQLARPMLDGGLCMALALFGAEPRRILAPYSRVIVLGRVHAN